jgi:hypothetical protein
MPTRVAHLNFRVPNGELEVLTYVGIQAHYIVILNRLSFAYRLVKNHSLGSTTIHITSIKRIVLNYRMRFQFGRTSKVYPALVIRCKLAIVCSYLSAKVSPKLVISRKGKQV